MAFPTATLNAAIAGVERRNGGVRHSTFGEERKDARTRWEGDYDDEDGQGEGDGEDGKEEADEDLGLDVKEVGCLFEVSLRYLHFLSLLTRTSRHRRVLAIKLLTPQHRTKTRQ